MMAVITLETRPKMTTTAKAKAFTPSVAIAALTAVRTAGRRNLTSRPATRTAAAIFIGSRRPSFTRGHVHCALTVTARTPIANKAAMTSIGSPF
jgi:hypothetical protein